MERQVIFTKARDTRLVTIRRGGTLNDSEHHLLALWAADCAQHVLHLFEHMKPDDNRPRLAIEGVHAWVRGKITMMQARTAAFAATAAAREVPGAAKYAALSAGQAVSVAHVAAHELGAAAYAIKAIRAATSDKEQDVAGRLECEWQRKQLPNAIRELVLDDQGLRNYKYWFLFNC